MHIFGKKVVSLWRLLELSRPRQSLIKKLLLFTVSLHKLNKVHYANTYKEKFMQKKQQTYQTLNQFSHELPQSYTRQCQALQQGRWFNWFRTPVEISEHLHYAQFIAHVAKSLEPLHHGKKSHVFEQQSILIMLEAIMYVYVQLEKKGHKNSFFSDMLHKELQKHSYTELTYTNLAKHLRFYENINRDQASVMQFLKRMSNQELIHELEKEAFEILERQPSLAT